MIWWHMAKVVLMLPGCPSRLEISIFTMTGYVACLE